MNEEDKERLHRLADRPDAHEMKRDEYVSGILIPEPDYWGLLLRFCLWGWPVVLVLWLFGSHWPLLRIAVVFQTVVSVLTIVGLLLSFLLDRRMRAAMSRPGDCRISTDTPSCTSAAKAKLGSGRP